MRKILTATLLLASFTSPIIASECGQVKVADMNWNSATVVANIDKFVLTHGFGCEVDLVPGETTPTGTSMIEKGEPDIAPEMWSNAIKPVLDKGVRDGLLVYAGHSLSEGGEEGFWVPAYMVEKDPTLATIAGIKANSKLFTHPEDPEKSAFVSCPSGWNCSISSRNMFKALDLASVGFEVIDPGSSSGLTGSIAKANERKEAWFGYYWAPTAVLGKYKMVKVDFGSGIDEQEFSNCTSKEECVDPKPTMYPASPVDTLVTAAFAKRAPEVVKYLNKRSFKNAEMSELLAWMEENQADGDYAMEHFFIENEAKWSKWLTPEVAKKVKKALLAL